jgi:hypothetical protein
LTPAGTSDTLQLFDTANRSATNWDIARLQTFLAMGTICADYQPIASAC